MHFLFGLAACIVATGVKNVLDNYANTLAAYVTWEDEDGDGDVLTGGHPDTPTPDGFAHRAPDGHLITSTMN